MYFSVPKQRVFALIHVICVHEQTEDGKCKKRVILNDGVEGGISCV